ncbi:Cilia- and flagella-associated protein 43 [Allomyces javanicus]|nr:Cilia- and flagella-associated protein 43 [Allomyces javanicus]
MLTLAVLGLQSLSSESRGFDPESLPSYVDSDCVLYASGNAIVEAVIDADQGAVDRRVWFLADGHISALTAAHLDSETQCLHPAGVTAVVAFVEAGTTSVHLLGYPNANPLGICHQRDTADVDVAKLAITPCARFLVTINALPDFTVSLWDLTGQRTPVCRATILLSHPPRQIAFPPAPPPLAPDLAADLTCDPDRKRRVLASNVRFSVAINDDEAASLVLFRVTDTFKGPQLASTAAAPLVRTGEFPGIDDTPLAVHQMAWVESGQASGTWEVWATVHDGTGIYAVDAATGAARGVVWQRMPDSALAFGIAAAGPGHVVVANEEGELAWLRTVGDDQSETRFAREHALSTAARDARQLVLSPNLASALVVSATAMTSVAIPSRMRPLAPGLPPITPVPDSSALLCTEIDSMYVPKDVVAVGAFPELDEVVMVARDGEAAVLHCADRRVMRTRIAARGPIGMLLCVQGTDTMVVITSNEVMLVQWTGEEMRELTAVPFFGELIKAEIEYTSHLLFLALSTSTSTDPAPRPSHVHASRPTTTTTTTSHPHGAILVINLDTFKPHMSLPVESSLIDATWDTANDTHVSLAALVQGGDVSVLCVYNVPRPTSSSTARDDHSPSAASPSLLIRVPDQLMAFALVPSATTGRLICSLTHDCAFKAYTFASATAAAAAAAPGAVATIAATPAVLSTAHTKLFAGPPMLKLVAFGNVLVSASADGVIGIRPIADPERGVRLYGHDGARDGVVGLACTANFLVSVGLDMVVRTWTWHPGMVSSGMPVGWAERVAQYITGERAKAAAAAIDKSQLDTADQVRGKLSTITSRLSDLLASNAAAPENEQVGVADVLINRHHVQHLLDDAQRAVAATRASIAAENAAKEAELAAIKAKCWDPMLVHGKAITSLVSGLAVPNFPLRAPDPEVDAQRRMVVALRVAQVMLAAGGTEDAAAEPAVPDETAPVAPLLFATADLVTDERKRMQMVLLEMHMDDLKREYNLRFEQCLKQKADDLAKINERYDRMRSVIEELGQPAAASALAPLELGEAEEPDRCLVVEDAEVTVPKYLSEEEEARLAEQRRADEERRKNTADDGRTRALMTMMGGTLEKEERSTAQATVPRPEFMDAKPRAEWSDEEKKAVKEYEKRVATLREEQEKYRKSLETELRKLEASVDEIKLALEQRLHALLDDKFRTNHRIHMAAARILSLVRRLASARADAHEAAAVAEQMVRAKAQRAAAAESLPEIRAAVEGLRETYESLVRRDRELEKQVKREFAPAGPGAVAPAAAGVGAVVPLDTILRLFRKRYRASDAPDAPMVVAPLPETDYVAGMTPAQWTLLNELRLKKMQMEAELRFTSGRLQHAQQMAEALVVQSEHQKAESERLSRRAAELAAHQQAHSYDLVELWSLKQGQVEVAPAPVVTDYSSAVLLHRASVEQLNGVIAALGKQKLDALREMKNYRRGILALDWELKVLAFQAEDVTLKTRDIQLLRVTKTMQEYLRSGDDAGAAAQVATLERQLDHADAAFAAKLHDRKRAAAKLAKQLRATQEHNDSLAQDVVAEQGALDQRSRIHALHRPPTKLPAIDAAGATTVTAAGAARAHNAPLAEIAARRRLVDLARAQAQDVAVLAREVQRWRLKTFPAFPPRAEPPVPVDEAPTGGERNGASPVSPARGMVRAGASEAK